MYGIPFIVAFLYFLFSFLHLHLSEFLFIYFIAHPRVHYGINLYSLIVVFDSRIYS